MKIPKNRHLIQLSALIVADIVVFGTINTKTAPAYMLFVGFLLFVATIYHVIKGTITLVELYGITIKRRKRLQIVSTSLIAGIIAMQSMGQLIVQDIAVISIVSLLIYLYFAYNKTRQPRLVT